jgi:hypothetical protein
MAKKNPSTASETNAALNRLSFLAGEWDVEYSSMSFHPDPSAVVHGRSSFEWLEGRAFMVEHSEADSPEAPRSIVIMALMTQPRHIVCSTTIRAAFQGYTR